ncbi:MAG TPA: hypothetical protein VEA58_08575, partial [Anaerovoracaceae bacterium]|nr:hypothetical protein [Anaerovoracaceae bacterium]
DVQSLATEGSLTGVADDAATFNRALTAQEVFDLYTGVGSYIPQQKTLTAKARIQPKPPEVKTIQAKGRIESPNITPPVTEYIVTARARIIPPTTFLDEVNATVRQLSRKIEIQWDGVTWVDESDYFLSARANEKLAGDLGEGIASTLDVEMDNTDERFTPDNSLSPISAYLKPRVKIRVSIIAGGYTHRMFTGYIKNIHPDARTRICSLECFDNQVKVYNKRANGIVYEDFRTDQLMAELAELAGLSSDEYDLDIGDQIVNYGYFQDRNVWPIMGEIAVAERGRVFFDRHGKLVFWNRTRLHNRKPEITLTLNDWITDIDYSVAEHEIKNAVIVKAAPRFSAGIQVVWSSGNAEFLDAYSDTLVYIPPKYHQQAFLELEDPITTLITPIPYTDYTANSAQNGTGDDLTNSVSIHEIINYGDAIFVNVRNDSTQGAFLTLFQIRADPAKVLKWIKVTAIDQASVDNYGRQEFELENNFITSEDAATVIADEELERRREAINLFRVNIIGIPHLLTGDVVSLEYRAGEFRDFLVETMDWTFDDGGFKQRLTLTNPYSFPNLARMDAKANILALPNGRRTIRSMSAKGRIGIASSQSVTAKGEIA